MIWFTSDLHLGHKNIIKYVNRPFMNEWEAAQVANAISPEERRGVSISDETLSLHDATIINNINEAVAPDDTLWHLGDFAFGRGDAIDRYRKRLLCQDIRVLKGNHDNPLVLRQVFGRFFDLIEIKEQGVRITLCHYAMRVWPSSHRGSWHLYGHSHGTLPDDPNSLSFDVGVDCWGFKPISFDDVKEAMSVKTNG